MGSFTVAPGPYRLSEVPMCGSLEVEHNWQVALVAQSFAHGIQDPFPRFSETAKDENCPLTKGIHYVANLLIFEKQVNKLRDLKTVYSDLRLIPGRDDQITLFVSLSPRTSHAAIPYTRQPLRSAPLGTESPWRDRL
jgi:hypothetical protein